MDCWELTNIQNINLTLDTDDFLKVCGKLKETKDCRLKENRLYGYMVGGIFDDKISTYVSYDKDKMNGCVILTLQRDLIGDLTLFIVYMFIDRHYPKLTLEYMKFIEEKAIELKADKISFTTHRNPKAIEKKYGQFGYKHRCSVIEKIIKKEVV